MSKSHLEPFALSSSYQEYCGISRKMIFQGPSSLSVLAFLVKEFNDVDFSDQ